MSKKLNETIGSVEFDGLIVSNEPIADVVHVNIAAGEGKIERGTVVTGTPGGELQKATAALVATNSTYIIADDVDATAAAVATAYRSGHFARGKLKTGGNYTLTAADEELLRKSNIIISDAVAY